MKLYLLSIYQPGGGTPEPDVLEPIVRDLAALNDEMRAAGAWVFAGGLHDPSTATVVRPRDDEFVVTDGPFAEGKEFLGGFTIIAGARPRRRAGVGPQARPGLDAAGRGAALPGVTIG